ncbi:DUF4355 domain-containing protein, partial [Bacillus thuringiensis]|nr:DUF4355 domain-containing protein [Bacillus thuringiensis]
NEITIEQVQEFLGSNPEAANAVAPSLFTAERLESHLETDEGKKFLQPKLDSFFSKSLGVWKQNHLQKLMDDAVLAANPAETPEQKRIKELELKWQQSEKQAVRAQQRSTALSLATEKKLPTGLVDYFVRDSESETREAINTYEMEWKSAIQTYAENYLGSNTPKPQNPEAGGQATPTGKSFTEMSYSERNALYMSNPKEFQRQASLAGM